MLHFYSHLSCTLDHMGCSSPSKLSLCESGITPWASRIRKTINFRFRFPISQRTRNLHNLVSIFNSHQVDLPFVLCVCATSPYACIFGKLDDGLEFNEKSANGVKRKEKVKEKQEIVIVSPWPRRPIAWTSRHRWGGGGGGGPRPYIHLISPSVCLTQSALTASIPSPFISRIPSSYSFIIYLFIFGGHLIRYGCIRRGRLGK